MYKAFFPCCVPPRARAWFRMKTRHDYFGRKFTKAAMETSIRKTKPRPEEKMEIPFSQSWFCVDVVDSDAMQMWDSVAHWSDDNDHDDALADATVQRSSSFRRVLLIFDFNWRPVYSIYQLSNRTVIQFVSIPLTIEWLRQQHHGLKIRSLLCGVHSALFRSLTGESSSILFSSQSVAVHCPFICHRPHDIRSHSRKEKKLSNDVVFNGFGAA